MIKNLQDIKSFLFTHIPKQKNKFLGEYGLKRIRAFLKLLNSPQNKLRIIHIAGTSGKGSTAYFASLILGSQSFKTGLTLLPHLIDFRERFQINNQLLSEQKTVKYFNEILPHIKTFDQSKLGPISYFEILVSFAFYIFHKERVNYAIIETGLGGLYDGTNCINSKDKIVILTKIGLDHTEILGHSIAEIAYQKAGIIQPHNSIISFDQQSSAKKAIEAVVEGSSAKLIYVKNKINYQFKKQTPQSLFFDFNRKKLQIKNIRLNNPALFQIENCALALAAVQELAQKNSFLLSKEKIVNVLEGAKFLGKMELMHYENKKFILDCAHNPQKMSSFVKSLIGAYPNKKFNFIVSFKKGKDYKKMLDYIIPFANKIYLTNFSCNNQDSQINSESPKKISHYLFEQHFYDWQIIPNPLLAIKKSSKNQAKISIITGSLYLLSSIYKLFNKK